MRSVELGWLASRDKDLFLPELIFAEIPPAGMYFSPRKYRVFHDGNSFDCRKGIIFVSPDQANAGTLAHEWRHHWQFFNWSKKKKDNHQFPELDESSPQYWQQYEKAIYDYFALSGSEADALRFELRHSKIPEAWEEILWPLIHRWKC